MVLPCSLSVCFFCHFSILITLLGEREMVFVLIVHLFVSYAHVNLCHSFSSSWCRGLAAASVCGSSWTFLFTFIHFHNSNSRQMLHLRSIYPVMSQAWWKKIQTIGLSTEYQKDRPEVAVWLKSFFDPRRS